MRDPAAQGFAEIVLAEDILQKRVCFPTPGIALFSDILPRTGSQFPVTQEPLQVGGGVRLPALAVNGLQLAVDDGDLGAGLERVVVLDDCEGLRGF